MTRRSQRRNASAAAEKPKTAKVTDDEMFDISSDQGDQGDDEPTVPVKLKFDAWTADGRCKKGETVPMPVSDAAKLIDEGKAERADPLPGGGA